MMKLLDKVCATSINPASDQQFRRSLWTPDTGLWLFQTPQYISWSSSKASFLWLQGQSKHFHGFLSDMCSGRRQEHSDVSNLRFAKLTLCLGLPLLNNLHEQVKI